MHEYNFSLNIYGEYYRHLNDITDRIRFLKIYKDLLQGYILANGQKEEIQFLVSHYKCKL